MTVLYKLNKKQGIIVGKSPLKQMEFVLAPKTNKSRPEVENR